MSRRLPGPINLLFSSVYPQSLVSERLGHASIEITFNTSRYVLPMLQERTVEKREADVSRRIPAAS